MVSWQKFSDDKIISKVSTSFDSFTWSSFSVTSIINIQICSQPFPMDMDITPICIEVHHVFHLILNELEQIYHGKSAQPYNKMGLIISNKRIH
jgi:hypothetical protein